METKAFITLCACALSCTFGVENEREYTEVDLLTLAYKPLRVVNQVELKDAETVLSTAALGYVASTDVYEISLADTDFKADEAKTNALIAYLHDKPLPRLRMLNLHGCTGVNDFLTRMLEGIDNKFYSLLRIDLSNSDATDVDVRSIINHIKRYDKLVRDMPMYSERIGSSVIQTHIVVGPSLLKFSETLTEKPFVYYRVGEAEHGQVPHQIKVVN